MSMFFYILIRGGYNKYLSGVNSLSADFTKWSNALKQFVGKLPTNCLSVFDYFVGLALKELMQKEKVHIDCEKGAQISISTNKIATL